MGSNLPARPASFVFKADAKPDCCWLVGHPEVGPEIRATGKCEALRLAGIHSGRVTRYSEKGWMWIRVSRARIRLTSCALADRLQGPPGSTIPHSTHSTSAGAEASNGLV